MATISENLQTIADSTAAIKQAIIDKGGTVGDITTWADAISGINGSPNLKKFTLFNQMERLFEENMTWNDWVNSIYNLNSSHYSKAQVVNSAIQIPHIMGMTYNVQYQGINVSPNATIFEDNYELMQEGGSGGSQN